MFPGNEGIDSHGHSSADQSEQLGEQSGTFGWRAYLDMQVLAVQMEPEVEERAALLLGGGKRRHSGDPSSRQSQTQPSGNLGTNSALDGLASLGNALALAVNGQCARYRRSAPRFGLLVGDSAAEREPHLHGLIRAGHDTGGGKSAFGITGPGSLGYRVLAFECGEQRGGERRQLGCALLGLGQPGGDPRAQVSLHVRTGTRLPHTEKLRPSGGCGLCAAWAHLGRRGVHETFVCPGLSISVNIDTCQ